VDRRGRVVLEASNMWAKIVHDEEENVGSMLLQTDGSLDVQDDKNPDKIRRPLWGNHLHIGSTWTGSTYFKNSNR